MMEYGVVEHDNGGVFAPQAAEQPKVVGIVSQMDHGDLARESIGLGRHEIESLRPIGRRGPVRRAQNPNRRRAREDWKDVHSVVRNP